ncbi:MAG: VWA domain-containing protein [Acidobacteriota bacterium]|nr:VWA domain-containing protein [Acidobacteriota bacterium]
MPLFLDSVLLFGRALRQAGLETSLEQTLSFARALDLVEVGDREQVFYAARSFLVCRREDLPVFESVFNRFWLGIEDKPTAQQLPLAPRHDLRKDRKLSVTYLSARAAASDTEVQVADRHGTYSAEEILRRRDFSRLTPEELDEVQRLIRDTTWQVSRRRTRRLIPARRGAHVHLRRMLRDAAKFGGIPPGLRFRDRKIKQRPLVLLADISGSMEKYSRLVLQFFFSAAQKLDEVESFVFGTRLTRVTAQLRQRNVDRALEDAANEIVDWSGGTRIGESLALFNRQWGRRVLRRGAVVVIVSDGWERGDVSVLEREMRSLYHRCYRLIWLNPYVGQKGYEPRVAGMAAALGYIDDFLPIHNLRSLRSLSRHLGELPSRRTRLPVSRAATNLL